MTEKAKMPRSGVSEIQALKDNGVTYNVSVGVAATETSAALTTNIVRIAVNVDTCIKFGTAAELIAAPVDANDMFIPAGGVEYFHIDKDGAIKVDTISQDGASTGNCYVTEMV